MRKGRLCGSGSHCTQIARRRTIFGDVKESHIVFCVDTSGSVFRVWGQICAHIIEHLCKVAINDKSSSFNVITFDDYVKRFRTKLVQATYKNIQELNSWLKNVSFGTSSYVFPALLASYSYVKAECVLLVTDGLLTKELYDLKQLSSVCNIRPLYLTLVISNTKPDNRGLELASKLITMTCCPKSKLNVIMAAFSGCFVQLSPLEWCIEVPSKLYGCPNLCFKYVLDNLEKYPDEVNKAGKSLRKRDENYFSSQQASEGTIQEAPNPKGRTQLIESSAHHHREQQVQTSSLLCRNDSQTQTMSGTSEEVNTTDSSSLNNSPSENHCHHHCEHNTCLGWPQKCVGNKFNQSRYRAARSFINGRSQLDWWADDIRVTPSAGALLLGHTVLAPKYNEGNRLFMATVLSQVDYCTFIICFDDPDSEIKHRENIQEIHVHELISYLDFHRHPINPGDFVLLPQSAAHSDHFSHSSDKYYLIPFQVGKVLSGCELRSSIRKGSTSFDTPLKVEFMRQNHDETVPTGSFKIPLNTALWIPHDLAVTKLLSNKTQWKITPSNGESHTVCVSTCSTPPIDAASAQAVLPKQLETLNTTPGLVAVNSNNTQVHHTEEIKTNKNLSRPFSHLAPFSIGGFANNDDAKGGNALNYAYTKDELDRMKNEFIDSDYASSMDEVASGSNLQKKKISKSESNILSEALYEFHSDTAHQFVERKSCESEHVYRLTNDEAHRICNQMKDVTTYVDPELQYGKLNIKWVKGQSKQLSSRPEWRYWGAKPIPQLIGPPIFEPFKDATSWGRSDRLPTTVNISRPEIRFTKFSNTPEPVDHCDSRNVQLCLRDSSVSNKNILKRRYTRNKT